MSLSPEMSSTLTSSTFNPVQQARREFYGTGASSRNLVFSYAPKQKIQAAKAEALMDKVQQILQEKIIERQNTLPPFPDW